MSATPDAMEIQRALQLLFKPGDTFEARCFDDRPQCGYFRDFSKLVSEAIRLNQDFRPQQSVYVTLNPVRPDLHGRRAEQIGPAQKGKSTKDQDILLRRWLLIDCDPVRPAGVSATDPQKQAAQELAGRVYQYLTEQLRLPRPAVLDSGNGLHLLLRLADLPNDTQTAQACEGLLAHLADRFNTDAAKVDTTTHNAARVTAMYGTVKRKGSDTPAQPHRLSKLLSVPDTLQPVSLQQLLAVGGKPGHRQAQQVAPAQPHSLDIQQLLVQRGIEFERTDDYRTQTGEPATLFVLPTCPWDPSHDNRAAFVIQWHTGNIAAGCHHDSCQGKGWADLRPLLGLPAEEVTAADIVLPQPTKPANQRELLLVKSADVRTEPIEWVWQDRIVVGGINLFAGRGGIGKTFFLCDLVARVTNASLNAPNGQPLRHGRVLYATGEDHIAKVVEPRMQQHQVDRSRLEYIKGLPDGPYTRLLDVIAHADLLRAALDQRPDTVLLVLDPISSFQGDGVDGNKVNQVRRFTAVLSALAEEYSLGIVGIHHFNKGKREVAGDAISGSHAYRDAARAIWLFALDKDDPTRRLMVCDKDNWAAVHPPGLAYRIVNGVIQYEAQPLEMTSDELLSQGATQSLDIACGWLLAQLSIGPRSTMDLHIAAEAERISERTLRRAKDRLGVIAFRDRDQWFWKLANNPDQPGQKSLSI